MFVWHATHRSLLLLDFEQYQRVRCLLVDGMAYAVVELNHLITVTIAFGIITDSTGNGLVAALDELKQLGLSPDEVAVRKLILVYFPKAIEVQLAHERLRLSRVEQEVLFAETLDFELVFLDQEALAVLGPPDGHIQPLVVDHTPQLLGKYRLLRLVLPASLGLLRPRRIVRRAVALLPGHSADADESILDLLIASNFKN